MKMFYIQFLCVYLVVVVSKIQNLVINHKIKDITNLIFLIDD